MSLFFKSGAGQGGLHTTAGEKLPLTPAVCTHGELLELHVVTELPTILAAATTVSAIQIPANSILVAVPVRVTVAIPTGAHFHLTSTVGAVEMGTNAGISNNLNTTDPGAVGLPRFFAAASTFTITPNVQPGDTTGRLRISAFYYLITPPTA